VAKRNPDGSFTISAGEISVFSVCPQSWHLKWNERGVKQEASSESVLGQKLHQDWSLFFEESLRLGKATRLLAVLLCLAVLVFMAISSARAPLHELFQLSWRNRGLQLICLVMVLLWLIREFLREAKHRHTSSGFSPAEIALAIDGSSLLPDREYVSLAQGLAGRPDALIREDGKVIPVERKPLAKKLRDRYVVQLLVYMRLVEEFEGQRPPHGYLLLGPSCRRIKVENSENKQAWVSGLIREMRKILEGGRPTPSPHPIKCAKCAVRERCSARQDQHRALSGGAEEV
jgi:CRISPR/Cas system-associated exonuclease Cas4 (RecB family)